MNAIRYKVETVLFILLILLSGISPTMNAMIAPVTYSVRGKVIDRQSRQPVAYANVFVAGIPGKGASTDSLGTFKIEQVPPGIYSLEASCIGYQTVSTPEYIVSASTPFIEIEMEEDANLLNTVVVVPSPFRRSIESPVSMRIIGLQEIEKSPGAGHLGQRTTYLFSSRQSYLQLLFKALGLPFLPNFIDGQFKTKTRFNEHSELTLLGLAGIDKMKLNTDEKGEDAEYLLSYLPTIHQETFTLGASYRHYNGRHVQSLILSHNYLNNRNLKYRNNDDSSEDNLTLRLRSTEQKTTLRFENQTRLGAWTLKEGAELNNSIYTNHSRQRLYGSHSGTLSIYETSLDIFGWGAFFSSNYTTADKRLALSAGIRMDGNTYNRKMRQLWKQFSPRLSASYKLSEQWTLSGSTGLYHQLPPYTALGYKDNEGQYLNKNLKYMQVFESSLGLDWHLQDRFMVSAEGFFKRYSRMPLSLQDNIPLACKGNDYGVTGNEALAPTASGRAYGLETMFRWQASGKFNLVSSFTLYRSEYRNRPDGDFIPSAWDNRFILNMSGTYNLPRRWSIGGKLSYIGGSPYTPYDEDKSSLVEAWDAKGQPYYDYAYYNTGRLPNFAQLDLRVDKSFYFHHCMIGIYLDIQNITGNKLKQPDVIMSTGIIENPSAPVTEQHYKMKYLKQESGTILPTLGITVEF